MPLPAVSSRHCHPAIPYKCLPSASPALHIPPEKSGSVQQGSSGTGLIPAGFTYAKAVKSLGLAQSLELLWFVPHAEGIGVETFQAWHIVANSS